MIVAELFSPEPAENLLAALCLLPERVIFLVDGNIKGELKLGIQTEENESSIRERKLKNWLDEMGW